MSDGDEVGDSNRGPSRRSILRSAVAGAAGVPLAGAASGLDEHLPDDPPPGPTTTVLGYDCDPDREEHYTEVSREPTHEFGEELTVELDSAQDGEKVQIGVLKPDLEDGETAPVILRATPYISDLRGYSVRDCIRTRRLAENYVQQGYAVAAVAVRGTGGSGGCMELFGPNEQADVDQAVTWLGEAEWSNGNVAIIGRSYDGSTPWMPARLGNPYLATVVPFSGVSDVHRLMYRRGASEERGFGILPGLYYAISLAEHSPASGTGLATYLSRASCPDNYAQGTAWSTYSGATGDRDPSGYWTERILKRGVARNYDGSVLMVHGLQDWNVNPSQVYPWTEALQTAGIDTHVYFGQFAHRYPDDGRMLDHDDPVIAASYNPDWADFLLQWFEVELKGRDPGAIDDAVPDDPEGDLYDPFEARVHAQASDGEWYAADEWPPAEATPTELYLGTDEDLRATSDDETGSETVYVDETRQFDPSQPDGPEPGCRACATFVSESVDEDLRIAGAPDVRVTATPSGPGGHLTAFLYAVADVDEGGDGGDDGDGEGAEYGEAELLGWGQVDLRFAQDRPSGRAVVPGEALDVHLPIEPLDAVVPAGERLALVLHQGTTGDRTYSPTPTPIEVETGGENALVVDAWGADVAEEGDEASLAGARDVDASVYAGGDTSHHTVTVRRPDGGQVRDVVPEAWDVLEERSDDVRAVEPIEGEDAKHVYFSGAADGEVTFQYLLEAPDEPAETGYYEFGPVEARSEGEWIAVDGTGGDAFVAGVDT